MSVETKVKDEIQSVDTVVRGGKMYASISDLTTWLIKCSIRQKEHVSTVALLEVTKNLNALRDKHGK